MDKRYLNLCRGAIHKEAAGRCAIQNAASREDKVRVDRCVIPVGGRLLVPTGVLVRQVSLLFGKDRRLLRMVFFQFEVRYKQ